MSKLKMAVGIVAGGVAVIVLGVGGFYLWAVSHTSGRLTEPHTAHAIDFPMPFPLTEVEIDALRAEKLAALPPVDPAVPVDPAALPPVDPPLPVAPAAPPPDPLAGVDLAAIAAERAIARGKHLVAARYPCGECHGHDFGGGTMVDDPAVGRLLGPNITAGQGSRSVNYKASDWDLIVRHGITAEGHAAVMPSKDFFAMSDRELSDIVMYIRAQPPIDKEIDRVSIGPLLNVLIALGKAEISAEIMPDHHAVHLVDPPPEAPDATFGKHIAQACIGCHRAGFQGGPIAGGPPDWPPAGNLTQLAASGWKYEDFQRSLREAKRPDGSELKLPMKDITKMAAHMSDTEMQAMWAYLSSLPPAPVGN